MFLTFACLPACLPACLSVCLSVCLSPSLSFSDCYCDRILQMQKLRSHLLRIQSYQRVPLLRLKKVRIQLWVLHQRTEMFAFLIFTFLVHSTSFVPILFTHVSSGSPSRGGNVTVYVWYKLTKLAHSFLFRSCVYFSLYGPFNCISFHKFSQQLSIFSLCSSGLISALLVLSTKYLFMKVSFSPDMLGSKRQITH